MKKQIMTIEEAIEFRDNRIQVFKKVTFWWMAAAAAMLFLFPKYLNLLMYVNVAFGLLLLTYSFLLFRMNNHILIAKQASQNE